MQNNLSFNGKKPENNNELEKLNRNAYGSDSFSSSSESAECIKIGTK
jgi:hypothetical protein